MFRTLCKVAALFVDTAAVLLVALTTLCANQMPDARTEALAVCPSLLESEPLTPYGFANATLVSLWYARNAAGRGDEIKQANQEENPLSALAAMMRSTKNATNDFICAKRSVSPFAAKNNEDSIRTAAGFLGTIYTAHININQRMLALLKKLNNIDHVELMDQISTLQVERGQLWASLVKPTTLTLMLLIDLERGENGKANRVIITKEQKHKLLGWADEHFPEFRNGTPKEQWSDPAKTAHLFFVLLENRKCSDE